MQIKDLDFITTADVRKLGDFANMTIDQFLSDIEKRRHNGNPVNAYYKKLYNRLKVERPVEIVPEPKVEENNDPILQVLETIPIDVLEYYVGSFERRHINSLKRNNVSNLSQLSTFTMPIGARLAYVDRALEWKDFVNSNSERIIADWKDYDSIHTIPSTFDETLGLVENIRNALIEFGELLISRSSDNRYFKVGTASAEYAFTRGSILLEFYKERLSLDEIAQKHSYIRGERVRQIKTEIWEQMLSGEPMTINVVLNHSIIDVVKSLKSECLFNSIDKFKSYSGSNDLDLLSLLGFDLVKVGDGSFLVPLEKKGDYTKVYKAIVETLLDTLLPEDVSTLAQMVSEKKEIDDVIYDQCFVKNVLLYPKLVDVFDNGTIQIKDKYLSNDKQRYARIIFNAKDKLTTKEVRRRYEEIYKTSPAAGPSSNPRYGICCEARRLWYYGEPRKFIKLCITEYAEEHKVFYYSDLEKYLRDLGYSIPKSIRTPITDICSVDNKDGNHFCHKDYVDDYPDFSWRTPSQYGQTNWMLKEVRDILNIKSPIKFVSLIAQLKEKAAGTEYEDGVKKNGKYVLHNFCGEQQPFMLEKGMLSINEPYFSNADFATLGLREGKYPFFSQIRSIAFNEVKKSEDGRKTLNEIIDVVNDIIDEHIGRNVILRALEDKEGRFEPMDIDFESKGGVKYVVWKGQEIKPEPTFEVSINETKEDVEQVKEIVEVETKPAIKFRQSVDWNELSQTMKRELSFCKFWMIREDFDLNESIDKFLDFLRHTENNNLNKKLPQNLYEYWFASTDSYDRSTYLTNLTLFFEALLAEIYYQRYGIKLRKKGLSDWAEEFDGLPQKLLYSRDNRGFDRIASDLYYVRNKIAHGDDIELSSWETAKTITDYVALYVYVIARYY